MPLPACSYALFSRLLNQARSSEWHLNGQFTKTSCNIIVTQEETNCLAKSRYSSHFPIRISPFFDRKPSALSRHRAPVRIERVSKSGLLPTQSRDGAFARKVHRRAEYANSHRRSTTETGDIECSIQHFIGNRDIRCPSYEAVIGGELHLPALTILAVRFSCRLMTV